MEALATKGFDLSSKGVTIGSELYMGLIHFVSCLYVLPVIPRQLESAGFGLAQTVTTTAVSCAIGCFLSSYLTNLPFVIAPPAAISIYLSAYLQQYKLSRNEGRAAVMLSGLALLGIGLFRSLNTLVTKLIPGCIQASTAVGIGLITALTGLIDIKLVIPGTYTILTSGEMTPSIVISIVSTFIIGTALEFHLQGGFAIGLIFAAVVWWTITDSFPTQLVQMPEVGQDLGMIDSSDMFSSSVLVLVFNLVFLYVLTLNGLAKSLSDLSRLTTISGTIPRGNWLLIVCGISTIFSGFFAGPPILISPESAAAIKSGAKSGLSVLICGFLFLMSSFFCPLFKEVPKTATSPLLILVGMLLFQNADRVRWSKPSQAIPAFFVIMLIPFTCSILTGIGYGYSLYIVFQLVNGRWYRKFIKFAQSSDRYESLLYWMPFIKKDESLPNTLGDSNRKETILNDIMNPGGEYRMRRNNSSFNIYASSMRRNNSSQFNFNNYQSISDVGAGGIGSNSNSNNNSNSHNISNNKGNNNNSNNINGNNINSNNINSNRDNNLNGGGRYQNVVIGGIMTRNRSFSDVSNQMPMPLDQTNNQRDDVWLDHFEMDLEPTHSLHPLYNM